MSHASLIDFVANMLLNCVGLTPLKIALSAFQLLEDYVFSSIVHSSSLLGTSLLDSFSFVGGDQTVKTAFHAGSSMDLMNSCMRAFQ